MLDTHAVARSLTDADFTPAQADAITNAIRLAADHGDHVTTGQLKAELAVLRSELREEIAGVRSELKEEIASVRSELKEEIAGVRSELKEEIAGVRSEIAGVRTDIANVEKRLVRRALGIAGVFLAIQRLWPAGG